MTGNTKRWLPSAVVVLAITAMAAAARRDTSVDAGLADGLWKGARPAMTLLAVISLVVVAATYAKHRDDGFGLLRRAGTATGALLAIAAVLTPIGLVILGRQDQSRLQPQTDQGTPPPLPRRSVSGQTLTPAVPHQGWNGYSAIGKAVLYLVAAAAVGILVYALVRFLTRNWRHRPGLAPVDFEPLNPVVEQLAEAVAAGTEALEYRGEAREAVIACYAAMEQALSGAGGTERRAADTPEEFLSRVTAAQVIPGAPARRLTELFREARFSRHAITEDKRDTAREALAAISEHLRVKAEAEAAAPVPVGGRA
jgi:hypothetical protein